MVKKTIVKEEDVIVSETLEYIKTVKKDEFIQIYLEDMSGLLKINTKSELHVLAWLWKLSSFVPNESTIIGNIVNTGKIVRDIISKNTGFTDGSIKNIIGQLVKKKLLITSDYKASYYLNPKYFFKGDLKQRVKCFKLSLKYNIQEAIDEETNTKLTFYTAE